MEDIKTTPANYIALLKMWQELRRDYDVGAEHTDTWIILTRMEASLTSAQIISYTRKAFPRVSEKATV